MARPKSTSVTPMVRVDYTITKPIADALNAYAEQTGLKKSDIIRRAIEEYIAARQK